ncbi:MAG: hypothetical protein ACHQIK_03355 [Candidatus Acidiferrales bacterium]
MTGTALGVADDPTSSAHAGMRHLFDLTNAYNKQRDNGQQHLEFTLLFARERGEYNALDRF